jgi:hypothetical protein
VFNPNLVRIGSQTTPPEEQKECCISGPSFWQEPNLKWWVPYFPVGNQMMLLCPPRLAIILPFK